MIKTPISNKAASPDVSNADAAAALARLYPELHARALLLTQCRYDADDLVQRVAERALNHPAVFGPGHNAWGWLIRVMRNVFLDDCRMRRVRQNAAVEVETVAEPEVDQAPSHHDLLTTEDVLDAMAKLSESQRSMLRLVHFAGRSYRDVSGQFGISCNTIGSRLLRARRRLKKLLEEHCCRKLHQVQRAYAAHSQSTNGGILR